MDWQEFRTIGRAVAKLVSSPEGKVMAGFMDALRPLGPRGASEIKVLQRWLGSDD